MYACTMRQYFTLHRAVVLSVLIPASCTDAPQPAANGPALEKEEQIILTGQIRQGTECLLLETAGGGVYSLATAESPDIGSHVTVTGAWAEMSFCMEGARTLSVSEITPAAAESAP